MLITVQSNHAIHVCVSTNLIRYGPNQIAEAASSVTSVTSVDVHHCSWTSLSCIVLEAFTAIRPVACYTFVVLALKTDFIHLNVSPATENDTTHAQTQCVECANEQRWYALALSMSEIIATGCMDSCHRCCRLNIHTGRYLFSGGGINS